MAKILALDIGLRHTGMAICDDNHLISFPYGKIDADKKSEWINKLKEVLAQEEIEVIVVGVPLDQNGERKKSFDNIAPFIALLQEQIKLPVIEWDERFTTAQAERFLIAGDVSRKKRKEAIDSLAATILLQSYLDHLRFKKTSLEEKYED